MLCCLSSLYFTFVHLEEAFIQSNLALKQIWSVISCPGIWTYDLKWCSAVWATGFKLFCFTLMHLANAHCSSSLPWDSNIWPWCWYHHAMLFELLDFISCCILIQTWNSFILFPQQNFLNIYHESACYEKDILVIYKGKRSLYFGTFCKLVVRCSDLLNSCLLHSLTIGEEIGSICLVSGLFWRHATADLVFFSWRIVVPNCLNAYCIRDERMSCVQRACGSQHNK